jgi:hypothetical protein
LDIENGCATETGATETGIGFYTELLSGDDTSQVQQAFTQLVENITDPGSAELSLEVEKERQLQSFKAYLLSFFRQNFVKTPKLTDQHVRAIYTSMKKSFEVRVPSGTIKEFSDIFNDTLFNKVKVDVITTTDKTSEQIAALNASLRDQAISPGIFDYLERVYSSMSQPIQATSAFTGKITSQMDLTPVSEQEEDKTPWWLIGLGVVAAVGGGYAWWRSRR